jgi:hypothetical protein
MATYETHDVLAKILSQLEQFNTTAGKEYGLVQDGGQSKALVYMVINLCVP